MRRLAVLLLAISTFQTRADQVEWLPRWSAGDKSTYEFERCKTRKDSSKPLNACIKGKIDIEVLRADAKGSLQRWILDSAVEGLLGNLASADVQSAVRDAAHIELEIEFDDAAQPLRLINAEEIRGRMHAATEAVLSASSEGQPRDPKVTEGVRKLMGQLMSSDASLLALVAKDAHILYSPLGGSFELGELVRGRSTMPSPFGGHSIESNVEIKAQMSQAAEPVLVLQVDETIDRGSLLAMAEQVLLPTVRASGKPGAEEMARKAFSAVNLSRRAVYVARLESPWAQQVDWTQTAEAEGAQRVETVTLRRLR